MLPPSQRYLRWRSHILAWCLCHVPRGGPHFARQVACEIGLDPRTASERVTPCCLASALMCCPILKVILSVFFYIPPGCPTSHSRVTVYSVVSSLRKDLDPSFTTPPPASLNSVFMFHLVNTDGNIDALEIVRFCFVTSLKQMSYLVCYFLVKRQ